MRCRNHWWILLLVLGIVITTATIQAQPFEAAIELRYVDDGRSDVVTFELWLTKRSETWQRWANATLRIDAADLAVTGDLSERTYRLRFVPGTSELPLSPYNDQSMNAYALATNIVDGRLRVTVAGPDSADASIAMLDVPLRIGRFEVARVDGSDITTDLAFAEPLTLLQAVAAKRDDDSVTVASGESTVWYRRHDNVPLHTRFSIRSATVPCDSAAIHAFHAAYTGDMRVQLGFGVECEATMEGFVIERALVDRRMPNRLAFERRDHLHYEVNPTLTAKRGGIARRSIADLHDTAAFRREVYAYRLIGIEGATGRRIPYDTVLVYIPGAIIANASIIENPFQDRVRIRFDVNDRIRVTARVYDVQGGMIGALEDEQGTPLIDYLMPRGNDYTAAYRFGEIASQGLVNIVLIGVPADEQQRENTSRVILKAQHLR